ncbi:MAG: hypothetical protein IGS54_14620 [Elainella sp. C42_A2020_010]|nr:hypothetical protein [Elainella sp. C42_A2020_010]RNJ65955.1 MAG: hypothetical protein EDM05_28370 [Leptolyngbya sp. IPPAS B-1204]
MTWLLIKQQQIGHLKQRLVNQYRPSDCRSIFSKLRKPKPFEDQQAMMLWLDKPLYRQPRTNR